MRPTSVLELYLDCACYLSRNPFIAAGLRLKRLGVAAVSLALITGGFGSAVLGSSLLGCGAAHAGQLDRSHYGPAPTPPPAGAPSRGAAAQVPPAPPSPPAAVSQTVSLPPPAAGAELRSGGQASEEAKSQGDSPLASENAVSAELERASPDAEPPGTGESGSAQTVDAPTAESAAPPPPETAASDAAAQSGADLQVPERSPLLDRGGGPPREPELVIREAPPEPIYEAPPPSPGPDHVWAPGYWHFGAAGFHWMPGFWTPMMQGYRFGPPVWSYHGGLWHFYSPIWIPQRWDYGWNRSYYNSNRVYRSPPYGARGNDGRYGRRRGAVRSDARGRSGRGRSGTAPPNVRVSPRGSGNPSGRMGSPSRAAPSRGGMRGGGSSVRVRAR